MKRLRRRFVGRLKQVVGNRLWTRFRRLDVRRERRRRQRALEAEIADRVRSRLLREHERAARNTLVARARHVDVTASQRRVLGELDVILARRPTARMAIIGGRELELLGTVVGECYPDVCLTRVPSSLDLSDRHVLLAARGPHDVILATGDRQAPAELVTNVLFQLRPGGMLVIADLDLSQPAPDGVLPVLVRLRTLRAHRGTASGQAVDGDEKSLIRSIRRLVIGDDFAIIENRTASLAKMREHEMPVLLHHTEPRLGEVHCQLEPETFVSAAVIRHHGEAPRTRIRHEMAVPGLQLREYRDVVCAPGQVLVRDNILLADTYRHLLRPRLQNKRLADVAPLFAQVRRDISNPVQAEGPHFYWDSEFPGHYGHVLTEQVSRLWAVSAARRHHPDLKVILGRRWPDTRAQPFELAVLASVGFSEEEILVFDRPTRVECLLSATPMLSMPEYVSPRISDTWDLVGDAISVGAGTGRRGERVFCSRGTSKRSCRNLPEVEDLFRSHGFTVVLPEQLSMADQIQLFRDAEVIAGLAGSALFTLMFCAQPKQVIVICPRSYTATNEYLIGAVRGHTFDVFWSRPDDDSFQSSFVVDMDREGALLRDHLAGLE